MKMIKSVDVYSSAKISAAIYAFMGFIVGAIVTLTSLVSSAAIGGRTGVIGALFGIAAVVLFPICYGILGFICGAMGTAVYNLAAKWVGGVEIELS